MSPPNCIGEPISWLRLELFATGTSDAGIATHVAECPACAHCLATIRDGAIELPRLVIPVVPSKPRRHWLWWLAPAMTAAVAAMLLVVVIRRDPEVEPREDLARVKGVGDVLLGTVRERAGTIREDMPTFASGDRWKVVVTCPPSASAWVDVAVIDPAGVDYPLAPARVSCGNRVVVPGAFTLSGAAPNRICVRVAASTTPERAPPKPGSPDVACVTVRPE
ncbi:MAG: hypothetical protein ABI867_28295 [Kofleriaceae bacterium]